MTWPRLASMLLLEDSKTTERKRPEKRARSTQSRFTGRILTQGLTLFHNPRALHPLTYDILSCAYSFMDDTELRTFLPGFYPFASQKAVLVAAHKEIPKDAE